MAVLYRPLSGMHLRAVTELYVRKITHGQGMALGWPKFPGVDLPPQIWSVAVIIFFGFGIFSGRIVIVSTLGGQTTPGRILISGF